MRQRGDGGQTLQVQHRPALDVEELRGLFGAVGWDTFDATAFAAALERSWWWATVRDAEGALGGFCRVISDGVYDAYLCNMAVREPEGDGRVGGLLLTEVITVLREHRLRALCLIASPAGASLYQRLGFRSDHKGRTGMFLLL